MVWVNDFFDLFFCLFQIITIFIFSETGGVIDFTLLRKISKPGQIYFEDDVALTGFFGQNYNGKATFYSTIIFTDYNNIQVRFTCGELYHFWYTEAKISYYISIKNRGFDSISKVAPYIDQFRGLGADLNKIRFLKNDLSCKNWFFFLLKKINKN